MFYIISIPHRSNPYLYEFGSEQDLINYVNQNSDEHFENYYKALEEFTHDWHSYIFVETKEDLDYAKNYSGHQWVKVKTLADKINL